MRVVVAGGHGRIALLLAEILAAGGHHIDALIRNPLHADDIRAAGANPVLCDLESAGVDEVVRLLTGADAAVFAAGAGPGSSAERKHTVDRGAAVLLASAAEHAGARRFVQISSMGVESAPDPARGEVWAAYLTAKAAAETDLQTRDLDWTILRPGMLSDESPTGRVRLARSVPRAAVSRADVAAVVAELLVSGARVHEIVEVIGGDTDIAAAVGG